MEVTKANLATYLAGLTPSATPYPIEITETVASDWRNSGTSGTVGNIINTNTPSGVYLDLGLTVIPSNVPGMSNTFRDCTALTKVPVIPSSVTYMDSTFRECTSLTTAPIIPSSVTSLYHTFYVCTKLTTVPIIPSSVTDMGGTFAGCTALHTIQIFAVNVDSCIMTGAFLYCEALANIYVTTLSESSWHLLHTNTDATGTDYTIYNPDGTVAGSGTVAGTSQVLTLYGNSDELVISANITPTLAEETATTQVQWHKSGLPYDDELMIFNAKNPDTVISNFITVNRAGEEFLGNASTADKWKTARNVSISDADGTNTGTAVSVDGSENETLKLPATIKATLTGNASTATLATQANAIKPLGNKITFVAASTSTTKIIKIASVTYEWAGTIKIGVSGGGVADNISLHFGQRADISGVQVTYSKYLNLYGANKIIVTRDGADGGATRNIYIEFATFPNYLQTITIGVVEKNNGTLTPSMTEVSSVEGTVIDSLSLSYLRGDISSYQHEFTKNIIGNVTGNAGTATKLSMARTINGVSFDGSANITVADSTKAPTSHASSATTYGVSSEANYGHAKASTVAGSANGVASKGSTPTVFAQSNHVHPTDTTREPAFTKNTAFNKNFETTASNIKANGTQSVGVSSNVPRADHVHPYEIESLRKSANFTLGTYADGKKLRIANTHATNTITCTLPTGQTMNGQSSFTIAPDTILEFELIGTAWKCVSNEWELVKTHTTGAINQPMAQFKQIKVEVFESNGAVEVSTEARIVSNMKVEPTFNFFVGSDNYYGGVQVHLTGTTITAITFFAWLRRTYTHTNIYGMK